MDEWLREHELRTTPKIERVSRGVRTREYRGTFVRREWVPRLVGRDRS